MELLKTIFYASYAFGVVLIGCELGNHICNSFIDMNDIIDQFDWYLLPHGIQKMLPIILIGVQEPFAFEVFGSVKVIRETFKKVS